MDSISSLAESAFASPEGDLHLPVGAPERYSPDEGATISQLISWVVIGFCTLFLVGNVVLSQFVMDPEPVESLPAQAGIGLRLAIGFEQIFKGAAGEASGIQELNKGPILQRMGYVIGTGQSDGFEAAEVALNGVKNDIAEANYEPTESELEVMEATDRILDAARDKQAATGSSKTAQIDKKSQAEIDALPPPQAVDADVLAADLELVEEKLGIAGELANAWLSDDPEQLPQLLDRFKYSAMGMFGFAGAIVLAAGVSLIVAGLLLYFLTTGNLTYLMAAPARHSHIYLEAFAVWIAGFVGLQIVIPLTLMLLGIDLQSELLVTKLMTIVIFYLPMFIGIGWMLIRHPQPKQALREAGFQTHGFFSDIAHGVVTYLACLPGIAIAMGLTLLLTTVVWGGHEAAHPFAPDPGPSHPIQNETGGGLTTILFMYFLAAVSAPIVEEIVFRGFLFRWLRDVTTNTGVWFSVIVAAGLNSLIFAAIHPQGLLGIPPLLAIGICMSLGRHWRGGLVTPMTIHAIHNGTLVTMLTIMSL